jgi:hypothetical protein
MSNVRPCSFPQCQNAGIQECDSDHPDFASGLRFCNEHLCKEGNEAYCRLICRPQPRPVGHGLVTKY